MARRRAFSLVELLAVLAIIAMLSAILLPALGAARRQARRVKCASNIRQMACGFHMYAGDYRGKCMPLAYTDSGFAGDVTPVYWWGTNVPPPGGHAPTNPGVVDHTRGFLWPYIRSELHPSGVYECPDQPWGSYTPQGEAKAVTSTYGYNGYFLTPAQTPGWNSVISGRPWQNVDHMKLPQRVFAFADALLSSNGPRPSNTALLDPPYLFTSSRRWTPNLDPTTAFRHAGRANAAFVDGHADAVGLEGGKMTSERFKIGSSGKTNDPHYVPDWRTW